MVFRVYDEKIVQKSSFCLIFHLFPFLLIDFDKSFVELSVEGEDSAVLQANVMFEDEDVLQGVLVYYHTVAAFNEIP